MQKGKRLFSLLIILLKTPGFPFAISVCQFLKRFFFLLIDKYFAIYQSGVFSI